MRILHVLDHSAPLLSGYTYRTLAILREQRRLGWETVHVTSSKHPAESLVEESEGFRFYRTPVPNGLQSRLPGVRRLAVVRALEDRLRALVPELEPDILHAHSPSLNGLAALRVGRDFNLPVVYDVRAFWEDAAVDHGTSREGGARYRLTRALETHVLRKADAVAAICEGVKTDIVARGIPEEKLTVIPNSVDVERFSTERRRDPDLVRRLGLEGCEVLGFLGSFYGYEGLDLLIEALPALLKDRPRLRVLLVGEGPREEALRRRAREVGVADTVFFPGRVPHSEVRRYYDLVDVLVYPRFAMRLTETVTPLKPLEAMAMAKLLVASNVGGHRELIRDGETGLLFEAGSVSDLVKKVLLAFENEELRRRIPMRARRFVEEERTWARGVAGYRPLYERLTRETVGV
ncbi:MAG TPA: TIGR04063 family PEP-CTERM/XrtA system glycosyltransferase [Vicinamibacteria bacterium]